MRLKSLSAGLLIFASSWSLAGASDNNTKNTIGGWYPVFFQTYDENKVESIVKSINEHKARRVVVLYDQNKSLADKIIIGIKSQVNFEIESSNKVPRDDSSTKYNHDQVVVTIFLK